MALIIENGSIVTSADSWVTRAEFITYAASLGVTVANTDATDITLRKAAQFIGSHEANLKGYKVNRDQPLAFPRSDVEIDGWYWSSAEIPRQVLLAQLNIALDIEEGVDPYNPPANPNLIERSVNVAGAISVEYAIGGLVPQKVGRSSSATALMACLLKNNGLMSVRLERS
jgi:hypothetical protein